jgi:hypothetical protein
VLVEHIFYVFNVYSGRKITESLGNITVSGKKMERAREESVAQQSV